MEEVVAVFGSQKAYVRARTSTFGLLSFLRVWVPTEDSVE